MRSAAPGVHVIIPTHTTRHLAACVAGLSVQQAAPRSIVVTCDTDDPAIGAVLGSLWPRMVQRMASRGSAEPPVLCVVTRAHQGEARLNQVRNNGLRAAASLGLLNDDDVAVVLDGDTFLEEQALRRHREAIGGGADVVIPYRINLDADRSAKVSVEGVLEGRMPGIAALATREEIQSLVSRHRRYVRQEFARRLGLPGFVKTHKPKILGGHHAVRIRTLRAVNGYDEQFVGYGFDDDDLTLRLHMLRPRPRVRISVKDILAFHLWHPSRAPENPTASEGFERFSREGVCEVAEHGWRTPRPQPAPEVRVVSADQSHRMAVLAR